MKTVYLVVYQKEVYDYDNNRQSLLELEDVLNKKDEAVSAVKRLIKQGKDAWYIEAFGSGQSA